MTAKPRQAARFGAELWEERFGRQWSLWDLWYCTIIELEHDGDPKGLRDGFIEAIRSPRLRSWREYEAKLNHLDDLVQRLAEFSGRPSDLAGPGELADKRMVKRARDKVIGRIALEWRAKTEPMLNPPRVRLEEQARFGWEPFPSDPARFYERLRPIADGKSHIGKYKSFDVVERLVKRLADLDGPRRTLVDRVSLYRAFHTAGLVLADRTDDSHGNVGEARAEARQIYLSLDWRTAGVEPEAYWSDLCALLIWEPYAIDYREETRWFAQVQHHEVDLVADKLSTYEAELRAAILDAKADSAIAAIAHLYLATDSRHRFVEAARLTIVDANRCHGRTCHQRRRPADRRSGVRRGGSAGHASENARRTTEGSSRRLMSTSGWNHGRQGLHGDCRERGAIRRHDVRVDPLV